MTALSIFLFILVLALSAALFFERKKIRELLEAGSPDESDLRGRGKFSELGLMSAGIAHEISNPLAVIVAAASRLEKTYRKPEMEKETAKLIHQISRGGERIGRTIQGIRNYVYRDDDLFEEEVALSEVIDEVLVFCGERLKNHGIEFRKLNTDDVFLRGYRGQLEQALLNLINNSFDAVSGLGDKWIEISVVKEADLVDIYFKDSGAGIAGDLRPHIMEPFFSAQKKNSTGLGLPLVKGICERHGGHFEYVPNSSNTTFLLELPRSVRL